MGSTAYSLTFFILYFTPGHDVKQNMPRGAVVGLVIATDVDAFDRITFSISSQSVLSGFVIDKNSGELAVRKAFGSFLYYINSRRVMRTYCCFRLVH